MDFNNSGIKSPFSPRVRQSIGGRRPLGLNSVKKSQSKFSDGARSQGGDVIYKTPLTTVETYGMPLPVLVTETLTFASGDVSVRMSPCGWCWLVAGRKVLAWPREPLAPSGSSPAPAGPVAARELTLPQTDLAHKADLVMLFYEDGAQMPSCIGVSPEGVVRYWRSVAQGGIYCDTSVELAGQECARLTPPAMESGATTVTLALATTTCTVCLLTPKLVDGRATIECRTLRPPSGWLGGIGRRVSLLFFGSMPAPAENKLVGVVYLGGNGTTGGRWALACAGPALQVWGAGSGTAIHTELRALLAEHKHPHLAGDLSSLEIIALDMRASGPNSLLLLIATINVAREPDMRYALATINVEDAGNPVVTSLVGIGRWREETSDPPRCLPLPSCTIIYNNNYIATVTANDKVEVIDVSCEGDRVLGAELCGAALVFSRRHGVLVVRRANTDGHSTSLCDSPMGSPCPSDMYEGNLSLYEIDPHEVSMLTTDACGQLKTAFLFHLRRDTMACNSIIQRLFPHAPTPTNERDVDTPLDVTVIAIATQMLDDIPAGDPRWKIRSGSATNIPLGSSSSLQILSQLRDKRRAFYMFLDFLRATGLWNRLQMVTTEDGESCVSSESALMSLSARLHAALALHALRAGPDAALIDHAIYQVVQGPNSSWEEDPDTRRALAAGELAPSDVCARRVTRVWAVVKELAHTHAHHAPVLQLINSVLSEVSSAWRGTGGVIPKDILPALAKLHKNALTVQGRNSSDANIRSQLFEAGATLAHFVLTDCEHMLHSPNTKHVYEKMRKEAIQPFIDEGQKERAAALAEKFKEFDLLIEMCVKDDDIDLLCTFIDKYSKDGMAEKAFTYLYNMGGKGLGILIRALGPRQASSLRAWAVRMGMNPVGMGMDRGGDRDGVGGDGDGVGDGDEVGGDALRALLELQLRNYDAAAEAFKNCALQNNENKTVSRVRTLSSLGKLCALLNPPTSDVSRALDASLALCELHAALPAELTEQRNDDRYMAPEDLVQMYIDCKGSSLTEYDYKKALDLTDFVQDMEKRDELRLRVWCACIMKDDWSTCRVDAPADEINRKTFFRLIDLVHIMGGDIAVLLPALEDILTARELAELVSAPQVHYILQYGYQCLSTTDTHIPA